MSGQCRKTLPKMLHKTMSRSNIKFLSLSFTAVKNQSNFPCILQPKNDRHCLQPSRADRYNLRTTNPTHQVVARLFSSEAGEKQEDGKPKKTLPGVNLTTLYCAKFLYALLCDNSVKYHVGRSFFIGCREAFFYVSDCLNEKNYDGLSEVLTPELLDRVRNQDKIRSEKTDPNVFLAKDVKFISFANINWKKDRKTKIKSLEILVRFAFFDREVPTPQSFQEWRELLGNGKVDGSAIKLAHFKFFRTYGEDMKDSPWIIKDLYYFTGPEKFSVSVK